MTIRSDVGLGPGLDTVLAAGDVWFGGTTNTVSPVYGDVAFDEDGYKRIWSSSAAALAPGAAVAIDDSGNATASAGGAYTAPVAVPAGGSFWAKATAK